MDAGRRPPLPRLDEDAARWPLLDRLLDEALDLPAAAREAWLEALPPGQRELAPRLRQLLAHADAGRPSPLDTLPKLDPEATAASAGEAPGARSDDVVGPFRLVRPIGEGGMGTVWLAERTDGLVRRPVALKLPRGTWRGAELAVRMAREREILASLAHPHIARLYDAGVTAEGQPWLALEHVEGRSLDLWVREERPPLEARLRLFLQVAGALAHAHSRLVVHRDLKPSNILVTADGQARLLDFGIAKLLEDGSAAETALTRREGRVLTPGYASPEQVAGAPLGVASDVYSLGVVLFEMLAGARPYRPARQTPAALEEAILHGEPARPSEVAPEPALRRALRGDLDTVVGKALKKRPEERYPTVDAFATDLEAWLAGRPVAAQPDSRGYRLRRLVGRNRLAFGAAVAVLLAVLGGAGLAVWQARVAWAEARRAEEVKELVASIFRNADPWGASGKAPTAAELLARAGERLERELAGRPDLRVELQALVGESLLGLQAVDAAEKVLRPAVEDGERHLGPDDPRTVRAQVLQSQVQRYRGRTEEMRAGLERLLPRLRREAAAFPGELVRALNGLAHAAIDQGRYGDAQARAAEAVELATARFGERDPRVLANLLVEALAHQYAKEPERALRASERALALALEISGGNPRHPRVVDARSIHGRALGDAGRLDEGIAALREAAAGAAEVFGPTAPMVGYYLANLAVYQVEAGEPLQAVESAERAHAILTAQAAPGSFTHAAATHGLGAALLAARKVERALPLLAAAAEAMAKARGPTHERTATAVASWALALGYQGRTGEAERALAPVLEAAAGGQAGLGHRPFLVAGAVRRLAGDDAGAAALDRKALAAIAADPKAPRARMRVLAELGLAELGRGELAAAAAVLEEAERLFAELQRGLAPDEADALVGLGRLRLAQGRPADALAPLERAAVFWREAGAESRWAGEAELWLGRCYAALGRRAEARRALASGARLLAASPIPADARLARLAGAR